MSQCEVGNGNIKVKLKSAEYLALKLSDGILNYDEELKKFDVEKQAEIETAKKRLELAGFIDGFKLTEKGKKALEYLEECKISG
jgi:hypothetical protein